MDHCNLETPYYLIDKVSLEKNVKDLENALNMYWDNYIIGYSFKTNSLPWLLDFFLEKDFYAEVVSDDEYQLARKTGYVHENLIYNGPAKTRETFLAAIKTGCIVNLETQRELYWLNDLDRWGEEKFEVGIRVNFDLETYCPNETSWGSEGGRFGFCYENGDLKQAIDYIQTLDHISLTGLHLHCSTKTRSLHVYKAISKIICEINRKFELNVKYVDVGGGFFGGLEDKPTFHDYMAVISNELKKEFKKEEVTLIVEPGISIVASPFSFVTSVIDVKRTTKNTFVTTDGSRINIDPFKRKSSYVFHIKLKEDVKEEILKKQVIAGFTCMEDDRLFCLKNHQQLSVGDKVIYEKVGAYTMCLTPLFIKYFPAVYVQDEEAVYCVRNRWTVNEYIGGV